MGIQVDRRRRQGLLAIEVARHERDVVLDAVRFCGGNISAAARLLDTTRNTIQKFLGGRDPHELDGTYRTAPRGAPWSDRAVPGMESSRPEEALS